jgi:hypothetical protein
MEHSARGPLIARIALWVLAAIPLAVGLILLAIGVVDVWEPTGDGSSTLIEQIDVRAIGTALLCTGIAVAAAALVCEMFLPARLRVRGSARSHDGQESTVPQR